MRFQKWSFVLILSLSLHMGCAAFPGGGLKETEEFSTNQTYHPKAKLVLTHKLKICRSDCSAIYENCFVHAKEVGDSLKDKQLCKERSTRNFLYFLTDEDIEQLVEETFRGSTLFATIGPEVSDPDLKIKIIIRSLRDRTTYKDIITAISLFLIPVQYTDHFAIKAMITNTRTNQSWNYSVEDSMVVYSQLLLILAPPFWPNFVEPNVIENMLDHLLVKMNEDGIFKSPKLT